MRLLAFVLRTEAVLWTLVFFVFWQFKSAHSDLSWFLAASNMKFMTSCETCQDRKGCSCRWYTKDSPSIYCETSKKVFPSDSFADYYFIYLCRSLCLSPFFPSGFFLNLPYLIFWRLAEVMVSFPKFSGLLKGLTYWIKTSWLHLMPLWKWKHFLVTSVDKFI